jgi:hypothetical protein
VKEYISPFYGPRISSVNQVNSKKILLGLLFEPEEGGSIFFRSVVEFLLDYAASLRDDSTVLGNT